MGMGQPIGITGDGQRILVTGQGSDGRQIFQRQLSDRSVTPLSGSDAPIGRDGAGSFVISPDNEWVVFISMHDWALKKVRLTGGLPITLTKVGDSGQRGLTWGTQDTIVFANGSYGGLTQVSAQGGTSEPLTTPEEG